jgi:hypothetical protein
MSSDPTTSPWQPLAYFCFHFIRAVVGAKKWKIIEKRVANVSNLVSASDIAFGWITLENAISRWEWEYGKDKKVIKEMEEHKDPSVIQPIYTT